MTSWKVTNNPKLAPGTNQVKFVIAVPKPLAKQVAGVCNAEAIGRAELCRMALREYLERHYGYRRGGRKARVYDDED